MSTATAYPDVNRVLNGLWQGARGVLGDDFVGLYLYGSLAMGDFDPAASDIDFVVVTAGEPSEEQVKALQDLHARLARENPHWAQRLEGSYIPRRELRRYDPARTTHLHLFEGRVEPEQHGPHWVIERYVLREHGLVWAGPLPRTLIDPIAPQELRQAVQELLRSWWAPMAENPVRLYETVYQRYAVLTMCRVLYTLAHGTVVSKPVAIRWAGEVLDERWKALVAQSLAGGFGQPEHLVAETREFIRYTVQRCERYPFS